MTGDNNKLSTIDEHLNKGNIMDKEQGITFISIHLNTLVGSVTGTLICIGLVAFLIYICSGPEEMLEEDERDHKIKGEEEHKVE